MSIYIDLLFPVLTLVVDHYSHRHRHIAIVVLCKKSCTLGMVDDSMEAVIQMIGLL